MLYAEIVAVFTGQPLAVFLAKLVSFEELHLQFKSEGLVLTEQETEAVLILFCHQGLLEKQVFSDTNTIWYRRTGKTVEDLKRED